MVPSPELKRSVLVVEDEQENRALLKELLSTTYQVYTAEDGEEGVRMARAHLPDVVLMDLNMPKVDGVTACEMIRGNEATKHIPVIILSGLDNEVHRTAAFQMGADDFLAKPFTHRELIARVSSKLRRKQESVPNDGLLRCGTVSMNLDRHEVEIDGKLVVLSVLEFNLLKYFLENPERLLSRQRILEAVWRDTVVSDRTVDAHISSLRKKITGGDFELTTVYGAGYAFKTKR